MFDDLSKNVWDQVLIQEKPPSATRYIPVVSKFLVISPFTTNVSHVRNRWKGNNFTVADIQYRYRYNTLLQLIIDIRPIHGIAYLHVLWFSWVTVPWTMCLQLRGNNTSTQTCTKKPTSSESGCFKLNNTTVYCLSFAVSQISLYRGTGWRHLLDQTPDSLPFNFCEFQMTNRDATVYQLDTHQSSTDYQQYSSLTAQHSICLPTTISVMFSVTRLRKKNNHNEIAFSLWYGNCADEGFPNQRLLVCLSNSKQAQQTRVLV